MCKKSPGVEEGKDNGEDGREVSPYKLINILLLKII
jgi:hypothetical protein